MADKIRVTSVMSERPESEAVLEPGQAFLNLSIGSNANHFPSSAALAGEALARSRIKVRAIFVMYLYPRSIDWKPHRTPEGRQPA